MWKQVRLKINVENNGRNYRHWKKEQYWGWGRSVEKEDYVEKYSEEEKKENWMKQDCGG